MWFRNKKTGVEWFISDSIHSDRLSKDKDYEEIKSDITEDNSKPKKKSVKTKTIIPKEDE